MKITIYHVNNKANEELVGTYEETLIRKSNIHLSDNFSSASTSHKIILYTEAVRDIFDFIEWNTGQRSTHRVEQGGILVGKRYYDEGKDIHYVIVSKAITADCAIGTSAYLEITPECWSIMHDKKDDYNRNTGENAVIVGWFHTHPNMLSCFMSGTDRDTQKLAFDSDNTYSIVINPQRHLLKAFRSKDCLAAQAFLLLDSPSEMEE